MTFELTNSHETSLISHVSKDTQSNKKVKVIASSTQLKLAQKAGQNTSYVLHPPRCYFMSD